MHYSLTAVILDCVVFIPYRVEVETSDLIVILASSISELRDFVKPPEEFQKF